MTPPMNAPTTYPKVREETLARVRTCVADSLAIDPSEVHLSSRLVDELGASSLDFIDIVFQLEKETGIKVRESEFSFLTRLDFSSPEVMREGHLTAEVIARLAPWLPELAALPDTSKVTPRQLFSLLTVESICLVVERQLAEPSGG